jgi:hypothetical protein
MDYSKYGIMDNVIEWLPKGFISPQYYHFIINYVYITVYVDIIYMQKKFSHFLLFLGLY